MHAVMQGSGACRAHVREWHAGLLKVGLFLQVDGVCVPVWVRRSCRRQTDTGSESVPNGAAADPLQLLTCVKGTLGCCL